MDLTTKKKWLVGLGFVLLTAVGALAGFWAGIRMGQASILNAALSQDARDLQTRVFILRDLRTGEEDQAINVLETAMDDLLITLDPQTPYEGLSDRTRQSLKTAISEMKSYREDYPREYDPKDFRAPMVKHALEKGLYE